MFRIMACNRKIRSFLGKNRLLPTSMRRASPDRRIQGERRIRALHEYLAIKGADRRFEPDRRNHIERRAYGFDFESPDDVL